MEEVVTTAFVVLLISWVVKKLHDERHLNVRDCINYVLDLCEASMYSIFYVIFAMYFGGIVEDVFPHFDTHTSYHSMLREVILQAMVNTMVAQLTIDLVQSVPIPDLGKKGKALAAKGGGVIFGMSLFARQTQWKAKVAALAALCEPRVPPQLGGRRPSLRVSREACGQKVSQRRG